MSAVTTSAFDLPDRLAPKADPALIARDEEHFAAIAESLEQTIADLSDRLETARKGPGGVDEQAFDWEPGGAGQQALDRDQEVHRLTTRLRLMRRFGLDLCLGHVVSADAINLRGARVHRTTRPHRQHGSPTADRLALPCGRAVLRCDPREPHGPGEPSQVSLDPRTDQRLLGRGVHPGRSRRACRARRPVRLHRQPGQQPVAPDAGRARHDPGRPGRHHPGRVPRRTRRRRRAGHRQDRRRPAPRRLPAVLRPPARASPGRCAVRRSAPALPGVRRRRPPEPRRGGRQHLHAAAPSSRGRHGCRRDRSRPWLG